jgi:hypothetical protein
MAGKLHPERRKNHHPRLFFTVLASVYSFMESIAGDLMKNISGI